MRNKDLTKKQIAAILALAIADSKLSRREWSALHKISEDQISQVLNGKTNPRSRMREILGIERVVVFRVKESK